MNCEQAQAILEKALTATSGGNPDWPGARKHIADCQACSAQVRRRRDDATVLSDFSCEDAGEIMAEYVEHVLEGRLEDSGYSDFQDHLTACEACRLVFIDNFRAQSAFSGLAGRTDSLSAGFGFTLFWAAFDEAVDGDVRALMKNIKADLLNRDVDKAVSALEGLEVGLELRADRSLNAGVALFSSGEHEQALAMMDELTRANPADYRAWSNSGVFLAAMGRFAEALFALSFALEIEPESEIVARNIDLAPKTDAPETSFTQGAFITENGRKRFHYDGDDE